MSCTGEANCACGCCSGIAVRTPQGETNPPGQSSIAYRTGTWGSFKASMLARLSGSDYPALAGFTTRADDDYSIALLDASAVVLDILTFYQERLANESYLATATQVYSLTQLSQLIGYQPSPGVSASVYLAFTLSAAPGLPTNLTTEAITIPAGTTVQSVPGQGQTPQSFQTSAAILGKPDWNALPVQTGYPWTPKWGQTSLYLAGTATQLQPGDAFLIVGDERLKHPDSSRWDLRIVSTVTPDPVNQRTQVTWKDGLGGEGEPTHENPRFYALRQRAALFGYNAINPLMLTAASVAKLDGAGLLQSPTSWIRGSVTSGTFQPYETVVQTNTEAYANLTGSLPGSLQMTVGAITGSADAKDTWVGLSSGAIFTPTALPLVVKTTDWIFGWDSVNQAWLADEKLVDLDGVYSQLTPGGWLALINPTSDTSRTPAGYISLFYLNSVTYTTRSDYSMSAKITRVTTDTEGLLRFYYGITRSTSVLTQSVALAVAEQPLDYPLYGTLLDLEVVREDLSAITAVAVTGKSQTVTLNPGVTLTFQPYDDTAAAETLHPGEQITLIQPPPTIFNSDFSIPNWHTQSTAVTMVVADASGRSGTVTAALADFTLAASASSNPVAQELALVSSVIQVQATEQSAAHTRIVLTGALQNCYDRTITTINANVGIATGGSPVTELLGSGNAQTLNQSFTLKQKPLTYVQAATPTGSQSSLQVNVNGGAWTEVNSLYQQAPSAQVFDVMNLLNGAAAIGFGDGVDGATLPTGQSNIIANYRVGIGAAGNVGAGQITTLVDRPLGVSGVSNPMPATGGQDAQTVSGIRANAPRSVLTLGRAVSIDDYQNMAASFAGIAQAYALWLPNGVNRGVFITVAASDGQALPSGNPTLTNLVAALQSFGNPKILVQAQSFLETLFGLEAGIAYQPGFSSPSAQAAVQAAILAQLYATYSFPNRRFGQGVSGDEVATLIQAVPGVLAVNVTKITLGPTSSAGDLGSAGYSVATWKAWIAGKVQLKRPKSESPTRICPAIPVASIGALPQPADILVLNPDPSAVVLGAMS